MWSNRLSPGDAGLAGGLARLATELTWQPRIDDLFLQSASANTIIPVIRQLLKPE